MRGGNGIFGVIAGIAMGTDLGTALDKHLGRLWPTLRDGTLLRRSESVPLRLTGSVGVNVEQAAQHAEVGLMKDECRRFPKTVVQAVLQVVLGSTQDRTQQLGTGIEGNSFTGYLTIGQACLTI
jgi:hypothetical protein